MATTQELQDFTQQVRRDILRMVHAVNSGHPGGSSWLCRVFYCSLSRRYWNIQLILKWMEKMKIFFSYLMVIFHQFITVY
jgi:transketolase N-terminal domain/subunit